MECSVPVAVATSFFEAVVDAGVKPAGLGARDTLRLEAGLPLHGHELGPGITPLQCGLSWVVGWNKDSFRGKAALERERLAGPRRTLEGLVADGRRPPRENNPVELDVTSGRTGDEREFLARPRPWDRARAPRYIGRRHIRRPPRRPGGGERAARPSHQASVRARRPARCRRRLRAEPSKINRSTMPDYAPHTDDEIEQMLGFLGLRSLDDLFDTVPDALRLATGLDLDDGLPEPDVMAHIDDLAHKNTPVGRKLVCFAGGGAYDHEVPAVVRALASRSEFVTSYTPYQPEVAQGVLQALFEFQTLIARLSGMQVANASLYDGAAAVVEAVNLGVASSGRSTVWVSSGLNPSWRAVLRTFASGTGHQTCRVADLGRFDPVGGSRGDRFGWRTARHHCRRLSQLSRVPRRPVAREGCMRPDRCVARRGLRPSLLGDPPVSPGTGEQTSWSAKARRSERRSASAGRTSACSHALSSTFGGFRAGWSARRPTQTGAAAYVTTLRAREQDIRREKATSNVCTNQTLMAVTAAIQLGWLGSSGLYEVALRSARAAAYCRQSLLSLDGIEPLFDAPVLREFALRLPLDAPTVVDRMVDAGFLAGIPLEPAYADGRDDALLVALTERRTRPEIDAFVAAMDKAVR